VEGFEFFGEDAVVVAAPAVAGDFGGAGLVAALLGAVVVEGEADEAVGVGEDEADVAAFGVVHPGHVGLVALVEPGLEGVGAAAVLVEIGDVDDADFVEAEVEGFLFDGGGEGV